MSYLYLFNTDIDWLIEVADSSSKVRACLCQRLLYTGDTALLAHFNKSFWLLVDLVDVVFI